MFGIERLSADDIVLSFLSFYFPSARLSRTRFATTSRLTDPKGNGPLLVDMPTTADVTRASWWDIWTAGVAVNTLCIQNGLKGTSSDLGKFYRCQRGGDFALHRVHEKFDLLAFLGDQRLISIRLGL